MLLDWGWGIWTRSPKGNALSYQHEKCWGIDHELVFLGSANATHNSLENCEEDAVAITEPNAVDKVMRHLEYVRAQSIPVNRRMIEEVASRPRPSSKGLGRGKSDSALEGPQQRFEGNRPMEFDIGSVPPPGERRSRGGRTRIEAIKDTMRDEGNEGRALSAGAAWDGAAPGAGTAAEPAAPGCTGRQRAGARSSSATARAP